MAKWPGSTDSDPLWRPNDAPLSAGSAAPWWRRAAVHLVAIGMLGLAIGAGGGVAAARNSSAGEAADARVDANSAQHRADDAATAASDAQDEAAAADQRASEAQDAAEAAESEIAGASEQAMAAAEQAVAERATDLDVREQEVGAREDAVSAREEAVGAAEEQQARNTFSGDGTYVIGVDIEPGTYRSDGGSGCYWARLSGLSGELSDIITNNISDGPTIVEILGSDAGFTTSRCATWTKTG